MTDNIKIYFYISYSQYLITLIEDFIWIVIKLHYIAYSHVFKSYLINKIGYQIKKIESTEETEESNLN